MSMKPNPTRLAPYERWWMLGETGLEPVTSCVGISSLETRATVTAASMPIKRAPKIKRVAA